MSRRCFSWGGSPEPPCGAERRTNGEDLGVLRFAQGGSGEPPHETTRMHGAAQGFTLLEVMVCLTVLAIGAALTLSLISGSLGNIRKVQQRTRTVEHAEAVMELALLDDSIRQPTAYSGDFEDGTRWSVRIEEYEMPEEPALQPRALPQNMPMKLLCYTVVMFSPGARATDYTLQTLKLVNKTAADRLMRVQ